MTENVLTEDFCTIDGQHYFVRCVLELPLVGWAGEAFGFGVWATLSEKNFALYREAFDGGQQGTPGQWFGWFSNNLKCYPDFINLKCQLHPQEGRQRHYIELEPTDHPLAVEQRTVITFDRLIDVHALNCHDIPKSFAIRNGHCGQ